MHAAVGRVAQTGQVAEDVQPRPVTPAFDALSEAVDRIHAEGAPVSDAELMGNLVRARREIDRLEAAFVDHVGALDSRGAHAVEGSVSPASWLRASCGLHGGAAGARVKLARKAATLPATMAAFARGEISFAHAHVIAGAADGSNEQVLREIEDGLVDVARITTPGELRKVVDYFLVDSAPDDGEERSERLFEKRRLHLSKTLDGVVAINGLLDPESGAIVMAAVRALLDLDGRGDSREDSREDTREDDGVDDGRRSPAQRRADALTEICSRFLSVGADEADQCERPHLVVVADLLRLSRDLARAIRPEHRPDDPRCACGCTVPPDDDSPDGLPGIEAELDAIARSAMPTPSILTAGGYCELESGEPICPEVARRIACDCAIVRIVTAGSREPLDVGRKTRVISRAMRRALVFRDRHCQYPGCDRPASWCDAHHCTHRLDHGPTSLGNLVLLCRRHHRRLHEGHERIHRGPDGAVRVFRPDGTEVPHPRVRARAAPRSRDPVPSR